jgi:hypothetical protein
MTARRQRSSWSFPVLVHRARPISGPPSPLKALTVLSPGLFQSGAPGTALGPSWASVDDAGISLLVSLIGPASDLDRIDGRLTITWPIEDTDTLPDMRIAIEIAHFIAGEIRHGKHVLVSCQRGLNRASLITALVLADLHHCTHAEAAAHIRSVRPGALSNVVFSRYLTDG